MGWGSGASVMMEIINSPLLDVIDEDTKVVMFAAIILALESHDWDTQDECLGVDLAFDRAMKVLHPDR